MLNHALPLASKKPVTLLGGGHGVNQDDDWESVNEVLHTGDAKFSPSTDKRPALMLPWAMQLMRMISTCCGCPEEFLQRSGMLLRCLHLLRHVLAACPTTPSVCTAASWALQALCGRSCGAGLSFVARARARALPLYIS